MVAIQELDIVVRILASVLMLAIIIWIAAKIVGEVVRAIVETLVALAELIGTLFVEARSAWRNHRARARRANL